MPGACPAGGCPVPPPPSPPAATALALKAQAAWHRASEAAGDGAPAGVAVLRPFAFMPYRAGGRAWDDQWNHYSQHLPMMAAAGSWVERRKVRLPDLEFFARQTAGARR